MTLVVLGMAWLLAMAAVALWGAPGWMVGAWLATAVPAVAARRGRNGALLAMAAAVVALGGGLRFEAWLDRPTPDVARYSGRQVTLEGTVDSEGDPGDTTTRYRVAVQRILDSDSWRDTDGAVLAYLGQYAEYRSGTPVRLSGKLEPPPVLPDFDYRGYLARGGIVATMLRPKVEQLGEPPRWSVARNAAAFRDRLTQSLECSLPEPEASLGAGIAFGRDGDIPNSLYADFRTTGLAHIVAVSGSNVSLVAAIVFAALTPLVGRRFATWPAAGMVVAYVGVAGFSASVVRAGIMAVVFLAGERLGRQQSALAALGAAAIAMTAVHPSAALDLGFQLSLAATAGLIVFGPWFRYALEHALAKAKLSGVVPGAAVQVAALSLSATLATLPVIWVSFGQVSLVGPLANVVIEPVFVVAFALSGLAAVAGAAWEPAGWALGLAAYYPLAFTTWFARTAAGVPFAAIDVPRFGGETALLVYAALAAIGWPAYRRLAPPSPLPDRGGPTRQLRRLAFAAGGGALALSIVPVSILPGHGPGALEVTALDVGEGDAILVTTPHGHRLLVDGGPSGIELARELGAVLPHWDRSLDAVLVTHPQEDHVAGIPDVLRRFHVATEYDTGVENGIEAYTVYRARARSRRVVRAGDSWTLDGVRFEVLWPPSGFEDPAINGTSIVLRLTYGATRVLLTGDIEAPAQRLLMARDDVAADVLKVPHHGSKTSAAGFLQAVHASVALISVGEGNQFGHPHQQTLDALEGSQVFRTDIRGRVTVRSDGRTLTVHTVR